MNSSVKSPKDPSPTGLELVQCGDWASLCQDLAHELQQVPEDPFTPTVLVVDQPSARRALSQQLAISHGICAGIDFVGLRGLRRRLEEPLLGIVPGSDPWRRRGLSLAVLDVVDECLTEEWLHPIALHLASSGEPARPGRRLATAEHISRLLTQYARTAPQMLRAWNKGADVDAEGQPLAPGDAWQPEMWRRLRELLVVPDPVSRHDLLCEAVDLATSLPLPQQPLHLVDPAPCHPLDRELVHHLAGRLPVTVRLQTLSGIDGPLERSWGISARAAAKGWSQIAERTRQSGPAPDGQRLPPVVEVHASHGPDRQVEVLREVLCRIFEEDPTLEARDVVVASTNIDTHAPLVRAAFCLDAELVGTPLHPGHQLRLAVADGSLTRPNQALECLRMLLHLAGDRATSQDLVDLCTSRPVAAAFDLSEDDLDRIRRLVSQADIRWGLDGRHRAEFGLAHVRQSTWLAGVDRILTGIAMGPQPLGWLGTALPVEQVDSTDVVAAGLLAEIVSRTRKLVADWRTSAPIGVWIARLEEALDLLVSSEGDDAWQVTAARSELADLADLTRARSAALTLGDMQAQFDQLLRPTAGRPNHGNGSLLVCGLHELGRVAHRVVVVLGLDDQNFPHRAPLDGDDLVTGRPGHQFALDPELDTRDRSRQHLLDAVQSAGDRLVVLHQGFDSRSNQPVPSSFAVHDLEQACSVAPRTRLLRRQHTLQPQSPANFQYAVDLAPFSFDQTALAAARSRELSLLDPPGQTPELWQVDFGALPEDRTAVLDVGTLVDFYRHPARELLRRRLGVSMTDWQEELRDELPIDPTGLAEWSIGDRMVRLALDGLEPAQVAAAERLRGELPPGQLGSRTLDRLMPVVGRVVDAGLRERSAPAMDVDCLLPLAGGQTLTGRVRVHDGQVVGLAFSKVSAVHLLQVWVELLLIAATQPPPPVGWRARHIGRDAIATMTAPPAEECRRLLTEMASLRTDGLRKLVPLPPRTAATFIGVTPLRPYRDHDPDRAANREFRFEADADWARFLDGDLELLRRVPPEPGDPGLPGPSRFENLSDWLFTPLREHLSVGNLR